MSRNESARTSLVDSLTSNFGLYLANNFKEKLSGVSGVSHEFKNDNASALLQLAKLKRAPWDVVSSMELADLTGLSIQVLANWRIRNKGPSPVPRAKYRGNKTYYRVFEVERWLRDLPVTQGWSVVAEWLMQKYYFPDPLRDEDRTWRVVDQLIGWKIWPLAHHPRHDFLASSTNVPQ